MKTRLDRDQRLGATPRLVRDVPEAPAPAERPRPVLTLAAAAAAVREAAASQAGGAPHLEGASPTLDWLVAAVADAAAGKSAEGGRAVANASGLHLLDLLRAEVLEHWRRSDPPPDQEDVFALLAAFEHVRRTLEPDFSNTFAAQLSGPDGLGLIVGLAHDLRSPLTSVLFLAETLGRARSGPVNTLQRRQLNLIYSAALALNSLASDVIELARGGEALVEKDTEIFSLAELVEWLRNMVLPIAEEKGVEVHTSLPVTDRRTGRPLALSRVLLNLMTNALKFTEKGFIEVKGVAKGSDWVEFSVRDTGHGISPEAVATLYQPFAHVPPRGRRQGGYRFSGTGLGLALSRKLVEAMGSELKYETRPDWGTRFYFEVNLPPASML